MKLKDCFLDDNKLRQVFSWLTRIGAAPKFGSRPIGWYQQHQCAAIEYLEKHRHCADKVLRCKAGMIQSQCLDGSWLGEISHEELYRKADNFCRTGKY